MIDLLKSVLNDTIQKKYIILIHFFLGFSFCITFFDFSFLKDIKESFKNLPFLSYLQNKEQIIFDSLIYYILFFLFIFILLVISNRTKRYTEDFLNASNFLITIGIYSVLILQIFKNLNLLKSGIVDFYYYFSAQGFPINILCFFSYSLICFFIVTSYIDFFKECKMVIRK